MSTQTLNPLPPQEPAPRGSATALNIILAVIGVLALLTVGIGAARSAMTTLNSSHVVQTADAKGITALDIQANSGSFELQFTDTTEAVLEVRSTSGSAWALNRSGSTLQVRPPAGWNDFCFFGCTKADNEIKLTLPEELNNGTLDAKFELGAGEFRANGNFNDLGLDVSAGELNMLGSAHTVDAKLGAGFAGLVLSDVDTATLEVSAGRMSAELDGTAPSSVNARVSAGWMDLVVPDTSYHVVSHASAGSLENNLDNSSSSKHQISVEVSAGSAVLTPGTEASGE